MYVLCILYWNGSKIVSSDGYLDDISYFTGFLHPPLGTSQKSFQEQVSVLSISVGKAFQDFMLLMICTTCLCFTLYFIPFCSYPTVAFQQAGYSFFLVFASLRYLQSTGFLLFVVSLTLELSFKHCLRVIPSQHL